MIKLNDSGIFVGELKEQLHNFNLPKCQACPEKKQKNKLYLDKNSIYWYKKVSDVATSDEYTSVYLDNYIYGKKYDNLTTTLKITNMLYDLDTHRYFGRYLRFLRDYNGIDLMSLYNCFDGEGLADDILIRNGEQLEKLFDTSKKNFLTFQIPIRDLKYTLFLNTSLGVKGCLHVGNIPKNSPDIETLYSLHKDSYFTISAYPKKVLDFTTIYTAYENFFSNKWENLYMILEIPSSYQGYKVLLEKDYSTTVTEGFGFYTETENKCTWAGEWLDPSLVSYTNKESALLADRLIEYITGNVINPLSEDYDIVKLQSLMITAKEFPADHVGYWTEKDLVWLKTYIVKNGLQKEYKDVLGYLDKDIERSLNNVKEGGLI